MATHNWEDIYRRVCSDAPLCSGWRSLARHIGLSRTTLREGLDREFGIKKYDDLLPNKAQTTRKVAWAESLNSATLEIQGDASDMVHTLEQLLELAEVDLDVWKVKDYFVNAWPGWARNIEKDLTFSHGKIDGTVKSGGIITRQLVQVKAWLVRIEPIQLFPTLRPIECHCSIPVPPRYRQVDNDGIGRTLLLADTQIGFSKDMKSAELHPFHDRSALDIVLQAAEIAQPDRIDILGDFLDLAMWTDKFLRTPSFEYCTQPAILEGHLWLGRFRMACPNAQINLHEGNHDFRMRSAQMINQRASYGLRAADEMELPPALSVPKLLALHELDVNWFGDYPRDEDWLNDSFKLIHGDVARGSPGATAKAIVQDSDVTTAYGHVHRQEYISWTPNRRRDNTPRVGFCPGCLCHIDGRVPGHKPNQRWQQGFAVVDYEEDGSDFAISPALINQGKALWNGIRLEARGEYIPPDYYPEYNWG